ncbi:hypothetical protein DH2020_028752 [Rehmannia glutinosa]|uniref:PIR2-like helical domain-containing protein n=1 Tax=Rehmannia glutinosa TaxID=99300 RepID=A0ABR0VRF6_REHGL
MGYCTEEQLEEILLKNLEFLYNEAINKLVALGYDEEVALKAILRNGHCYGGMDVLTNILHNSLAYLNSGGNNGVNDEEPEPEPSFADLRQLEDYSLAGMVCLLQQVKPHLSKGDAMWCLLMSDLHVGRASVMEIRFCHPLVGAQVEVGTGVRVPQQAVFHSQSQACPSSLSGGNSSGGCGTTAVHSEESQYAKNQDVVNSVMSKFRDLNLDENTEQVSLDQKDEMILSLIHQIKDLEKQVKERKEWAHQKAMQAARKLSHDLTELKMLRMEREETQRLKNGKTTLEPTTVKRLNDMEEALRMASGQVDRANTAVRMLETQNAEIRAEMEASKLSASESKLLAWEKQKTKMQEEIAAEKQKISELLQELAQVEAATKEAEAKWRQEQKAKELVLAQLEEERRLKEASEANNKRKLEALRLKIEIDFQRHKDDLQRLEQEYARLKESAQSAEVENQSHDSWTANSNGVKPQGETIARLLHELDQMEDSPEKAVNCDRECMICMKDEVSVVFLPCAHQVICANCNEKLWKER